MWLSSSTIPRTTSRRWARRSRSEKARHLSGDDARILEASLARVQQDNHVWVWKDAEMGMSERILKLHAEAPDLNQSQLAEELGCNRSTVCRVLKNATIDAAGGMQ